MKRIIFGLVVLLTLLASPATARSLTTDAPVSGSYSGTGTISIESCEYIRQNVSATGSLVPFGESQIALNFCLGDVPEGSLRSQVLDGAFTISAADGTVSGSIGGFVQPFNPGGENVFPYQLVLTIAGGTGSYAGSTGTIVLDGFFGLAGMTTQGTASGTLFSAPTKSDCKHGGWRTAANPSGQPYANQGRCVSSVKFR
jgi:hypothetical protein